MRHTLINALVGATFNVASVSKRYGVCLTVCSIVTKPLHLIFLLQIPIIKMLRARIPLIYKIQILPMYIVVVTSVYVNMC